MRFIIDLYRYILLTMIALVLIGVMLLALAAVDPNGPFQGEYAMPAIIAAFAVGIFLVLSVGGLAIVISIHDRHAEIADYLGDIADSLHHDALDTPDERAS